ncbi:MAG: hypothetical protein K6F99_04540 [Lachnospiraceae bacterium]|nr:hypothetical protein [Lachnospiraceae bacterium]
MNSVAIVMGVAGILTSFLAIGILPSFIGVIVALTGKKKDKKKKIGLVTSVIGLILSCLFIFLYGRALKTGGPLLPWMKTEPKQDLSAGIVADDSYDASADLSFANGSADLGTSVPDPLAYQKNRTNITGSSNLDFDEIETNVVLAAVNGDDTGLLRYCTVKTDKDLKGYIFSYYDKHFDTADEIHGIINTENNTITKIECVGEYVVVSVYPYKEGQENNVMSIFPGEPKEQYNVFLDNGDVQTGGE